ncbi:hypothetical protein [aff. Roholtiella sp. LEGE 12411]|nr:hypothetical protein [aff. Roholtiella sp. LEGE 12411]MBE9038099.1 hypothetical protein [aff. Roholtiella sp. LEGE 12411]
MGHGKEATNALPYAQSGRVTIPLQTPGDGVFRRFQSIGYEQTYNS